MSTIDIKQETRIALPEHSSSDIWQEEISNSKSSDNGLDTEDFLSHQDSVYNLD